MPNPPEIVYSRVFLPHPLPAAQVSEFFTRLAAGAQGHVVVLETRADADGVIHLIGCEPTFIHELHRMIGDLIPGTLLAGLDGYARGSVDTAATLKAKPASLPLAVSDPEPIVRAMYSVLSRRFQPGETLAVQLVLGDGMAPTQVPAKITDPAPIGIWKALTSGSALASSEVRNKVRDHAAEYRLDVTIRVGVSALDARKRRRMALEMLAAMRTAQSPGVKLELNPGDPTPFNQPRRPRWFAQRLAVSELVAFCGWPVASAPLPGMPPAHPKLLRAEPNATNGPLVVAQSLVPGDRRLLGLTEAAMMFHLFALGPTGVGKTTMLEGLMLAAIRAGHPLLILDPKAQTPDALLARIPRERWKDVYEINAADLNPNGFNPLDPGDGDPDVQADSVLAVFERIFEHLGTRTSDIFSASIRTLIRTGTKDRPNTLLDLPTLWTDAAYRRSQVAKVQHDPTLAGFWAWYDSQSPGQQMNVIAPAMNRLRKILLRPAAVKILGQRKPAFRLRDLFRAGKIVIVPLNEALIGELTADLLGSLIIAEIWQATQERAAEPDHQKHPGFVFVDEADRFMNGTLTVSLSDALARSRSLSVGWALSTQYWDQLPKPMKSAIKSNARSKVIFRLEDDDDARTIARLAPELDDIDFTSLAKYQVYVRMVIDGVTGNWALGQTLPPENAVNKLSEVRAVARAHHPTEYVPLATAWNGADEEHPGDEHELEESAVAVDPGPVGRRRRPT